MKMKMKGQIESIYPIKEHKIKRKTAKKAQKKPLKAEQAEQELALKAAELKQQEDAKAAKQQEDAKAAKQQEDAKAAKQQEDAMQTRASKNSQPLDNQEKRRAMKDIINRMMEGELSQGETLKMLRIRVLGLKQEDYAQLVGVSRKTLSENENNKGNYSTEVVNKVFQPFGLKVGLVATSPKAR